MGSNVYQRGEAAGELKMLTRLMTKRLGERASPLVSRLLLADAAAMDAAADLLAERLSDDELLARLEEALPGPEGTRGRGE